MAERRQFGALEDGVLVSLGVRRVRAIDDNQDDSVWSNANAVYGRHMDLSEKDLEGRNRGRMDFLIEKREPGSGEEETGLAITIQPDPRRYELIEHGGRPHFLDRYLRTLISQDDMLEQMAHQLERLPLYSLSPAIDDTPTYAAERRKAAIAELDTGTHQPPSQSAKPHQRFEDDSRPRETVFLSVDIVGGTAERRADPHAFEMRHGILVRELGTLVGLFNGAIHKLTGDGFIALIDFPGFTSQCDAAADLGLSMLRVLHETVNPALEAHGLSPLMIRIGADYGAATFRTISIPSTDYAQVEIASDALNRAVKIEKSCKPNEFRLGRTLYELLHVKWLERAEEAPFDGESIGWPGYRTYRMR